MQIEEIIQGKKGKLIIRAEGGLSFPLYEKDGAHGVSAPPETAGERLSGRNRGVCHGLCEVFSLCG